MKAMQAGGAIPKRRGKARGSKPKSTPNNLGASQAGVVSVGGSGRSRRKRNKVRMQGGQGTITLSRREMLRSVKVGPANSAYAADSVEIQPNKFQFLKQFTMFDKVKWQKLHIFYKPGVGANFNGFVSYGVSWDMETTDPKDREAISALTPNMSHALWFDGEARPLVCPQSKLAMRAWYTPTDTKDLVERGPGKILIGATTSGQTNTTAMVVGELWADYTVTLTGSSF